jgi:WD40 repeat protein
VVNLIKLALSNQQVTFEPDNFRDFSRTKDFPEAGDFQVTIVNTSQKFASFQLELWPQGSETSTGAQWYRVEPHVSAKKPPGDRTTFQVTLLKSPVPAYDITLPLTVRVVSVELAELIAEEVVFLKVVRPHRTLHVYLPFEDLTVHPGNRLQIPVLLYNLNPSARAVTLRLKGLDPTWFPDGTEQTVQIDSGDSLETTFWCAPPAICQSLAQVYSLQLEAFDGEGNSDSRAGNLEVRPFGELQIDCFKPQQWVPRQQMWWTRQRLDTAIFDLILNNQSNVSTRVSLLLKADRSRPILAIQADDLVLESAAASSVAVEVKVKRPWLGLPRHRFLTAQPQLTLPGSGEAISQVTVQPASQTLELKIRPVLPLLLQLGAGVLGLFLVWLVWWLTPRARHQAPVNALTLMANGTTVVSGSRDQTLRFWQVNQDPWMTDIRRLKDQGVLQTENQSIGKAVRTLQQIPAEVESLAVGLENGEIQIWDISPPNLRETLFEQAKPDRVFALDFTNDSTNLFSGHGSGLVRRWDMTSDQGQVVQRLYPSGGRHFAVAALTVLEPPEQPAFVAVGGQFNRLALWDWQRRRVYDIPYVWQDTSTSFAAVVSRQSYLTDLTAADRTGRLVSADNQGFITVWDLQALQTCMDTVAQTTRSNPAISLLPGQQAQTGEVDEFGNRYGTINRDCATAAIADQWQAGRNGMAIRSVAIAENGCYLASAGDDGRVLLWPLTQAGKRPPDVPDGKVLKRFRQGFLNSVDIHYTTQNGRPVVFVASDTPDNRVRLYRQQVASHDCQ